MLRRVLIACIIINLEGNSTWQLSLLFLVNILALIYTCISRPFKETLVNVHMIINDVGVLIVNGEMYMMIDPYVSDKVYFGQGQIIIATIATIIFVNFALFLLGFILGLIDFCRKCPMCSCCKKRRPDKEAVEYDPFLEIPKLPDDIFYHTPTPTPPRTPTPPKTPTPP